MDAQARKSAPAGANNFISKDMIYTTAAIQRQIMNGLQYGGSGQSSMHVTQAQDQAITALQHRPTRERLDPQSVATDQARLRGRKVERSAADQIEANKFQDNKDISQLNQTSRADAFLFREEAENKRGVAGRPESGATKRRASSPDLGGVANPFIGMERPKTVKNRSGKSQERGLIAGGKSMPSGLGGPVPKNFAYKQRVKHFADPVDYPQQNYEKRIKDLAKNNITRTQLNPKVVETWLNETLTDAGHLEIPGVILQPESQKPLMRYKIGANQLKDNQISMEQTNRIYRALFVYSLGFYEMLQREVSHSPNKNSIQNSIWKVFTILLEYCCKTNYQMLVRGMQIEHKVEMEREEERFNEYQDRMTKNENKLKDDLGVLHVDNEKLTREIEELKHQNKKVNEDWQLEKQTHEEEVQLRLQFESKLNSLHALHRDVKNLYSRAIEDILGLKTQNEEQEKVIKKYEEELIQLRSTKESNQQEISTLKESLTQSENEVTIKTIAIKKLQDEILQKDRENDKLQQDVNNQEQIYYGLQMEISKHKSDKQSLDQDMERLTIELDLTKQMRDQFCDQFEDVSSKYKDLLGNFNSIQKDYVAIDELKRDRDYRINMLREELSELSTKHEKLCKDHAGLEIRHESCVGELDDLKKDDEKLVAQLEQANNARREHQERIHKMNEDSKIIAQKFEESKEEIVQLKKQGDKLQQRLDQAERDYAELQVRYDSEQKQSEIQRQQLNDKLKNLDQLLCNEKDTRETWMSKCQLEQEMHTKTNVELLRIRSLHQSAEMEHKNAIINFETVKDARATLSKEHETLLKEASQLRAKNENLEREVFAKIKLLESVEAQQKAMLRQLREDNKKVIEDYEIKVLEKVMQYEDLRSFCVKKQTYSEKLLQEIKDLEEKLQIQKDENAKLDKQIEMLEKEVEGEQDAYQVLKRETSDLRLQNSLKEKENEQFQRHMTDQAIRIQELMEEAKRAAEQIAQIDVLDQEKKVLEQKLKKSQELLSKQLKQTEGVERGYGPNNVIYQDDEAQTEADQLGQDPNMVMDGQLEGMVDYSSQQMNSFHNTQQMNQQQHQQQRNMQMMMGGDNQSVALMMNNHRMTAAQGMSSQSHQGLHMGAVTPKTHQMNQMMLNQASHLNISHANTRQAISLGKSGLGRIQSAVNTVQSTAIGSRHHGQAHMNLVSQGYRTGLSSHGAINSQDGIESQSKSKTQIHRTISGEAESKSTDRKNNYIQQQNLTQHSMEAGRNNLAVAMGAQAGLDLSIDEQVQRYAPNSNNRPTTGVPTGYRNNFASGETPLLQGQIAPHALYNHHAYSKKSFRIRGQAEQEFMKMQMSSSNKDMAIIDFNNDILKSVYELRKSHAALAGRPTTQQLITKGRRDIQSAVARQKEMAFGGFMIPNQMDQESAENFFNQFPMNDPNKILEMNEQIAQEATLQIKEKKAKSMRTSIPNNAPVPRHPGPISQIQIQQKPALSTMKQKKPATVGLKSPIPDTTADKVTVVDGMRSTSNISGTGTKYPVNQNAIPVKGLRYPNESISVSGASVNVMTNAFTGANPHKHLQQAQSNVSQVQQHNVLVPATQQLLQNRNSSVLTSGGGSHAEGLRLAESLSNFNMNAVVTTKSAGNINQRAKAGSSQGGAGRNIKNIIKMASSREGLRD